MTRAEQLELREQIRAWLAANPDARWIDSPIEFDLPEYPEGQIASWLDRQVGPNGERTIWCRRHDVEFTAGDSVCAQCAAG
jgi:hypothetical protein